MALIDQQEQPVVNGVPSYWVANDRTEVYITEQGGHMAPVNFKLKHRWVSPFSIAPWQPEEFDHNIPPILQVLRGDFLCLPFGECRKAPHVHGDTANERWRLTGRTIRSLQLQMDMPSLGGRVTKNISLKEGQRAVYQEHIIEGVQGRYPIGTHAILQFPRDVQGWLNTSTFSYGATPPEPFNNPAGADYGCLRQNQRFSDLAKVEGVDGQIHDLHRYPNREGFDDLVMLTAAKRDSLPFAWTAATMDGYVFLQIKDPKVLPSTLLWFSNGGRHALPWQGRHRRRVGIEEVCSAFALGCEKSRRSPLEEAEGIPTTHKFSRSRTTRIALIQAAHPVPKSFGMVTQVEPGRNDREVRIVDNQGNDASVPLNWDFLHG